MFETYKDLGKDKAEIFAEVTRRMMAENLGLPLFEGNLKDKYACKKEMKAEYKEKMKRK